MSPRHRTRRPLTLVLAALVAGITLVAVGCSGSGADKLLVAADTSSTPAGTSGASGAVSTDIWEVAPGDTPSDANRVAVGVVSPQLLSEVHDDGSIARDVLGVTWDGRTLTSFRDADGSAVQVVDPGDEPATVARSESQAQATVLRRGVYVATAESCVLARSASDANDAETLGDGLCSMSEDERWVVSWPAERDGGTLTIRDLRTGTVRRVDGRFTGAVALGHTSKVFAVEATGDGARGVTISASDGTVVSRTDTYGGLQAMPSEHGSTGFVALAATGESGGAVTTTDLLWIDTDGKVHVIDRGSLLLPIRTDSAVTYVRLDSSSGTDSIRRWDSDGGERTVLLSGRVGAAAVSGDSIVATRDADDGVELYRSDPHGGLVHVATVPGDATTASFVQEVLTQGDTTLMHIRVGERSALARIDLTGDDSSVPVTGWADLRLEGVDADGTALVSGRRAADATRESVGVVTPHGDGYVERTTADRTGLNLIHEGVLYVTDQSASGELTIRTVRAQGDPHPEVLWRDHQLAGATWPTNNGATTATLISRAAVLQRQQSLGGG